MKDAPHDMAEDVTQDAAEDVLGATEDGSSRHVSSSSGGTHAKYTHSAPHAAFG